MTPLTDAQLAAILTDGEILWWSVWIEQGYSTPISSVRRLFSAYEALAARLAEAEQTIEQRVATIHGLSKIIDGHEAEMEDLAQRCDKAVFDLAAAQATIERLTTALAQAVGVIESLEDTFSLGVLEGSESNQETVEDLGLPYEPDYPGWVRGEMATIAAALAPPAPEADDAAPTVQE